MYEMLPALDDLPRQVREELMRQGYLYRSTVNMPRIEYAMAVVQARQLPPDAPGDLAATGQVQVAREFLRQALPNLLNPILRPKKGAVPTGFAGFKRH